MVPFVSPVKTAELLLDVTEGVAQGVDSPASAKQYAVYEDAGFDPPNVAEVHSRVTWAERTAAVSFWRIIPLVVADEGDRA